MKKILIPVVWIILSSCNNNPGKSNNKNNDTANLHTPDTAQHGDSSTLKIDNTENKENEDSLPPMQH